MWQQTFFMVTSNKMASGPTMPLVTSSLCPLYLSGKLHSCSRPPWPACGRRWRCPWCSSCPLSWWGWCGRCPGCCPWRSSRCSTGSCPIRCSRTTVSSEGGRDAERRVRTPAGRWRSPPAERNRPAHRCCPGRRNGTETGRGAALGGHWAQRRRD